MIISHSHQFIFVHVYKVAGISVKAALSPFAYHPDRWLLGYVLRKIGLKGKIKHHKFLTFPVHITALELKKCLPAKIFDTYFKFVFVRNPWDWQVSLYYYMLQTPHHRQHELIKTFKSFDQYIEWRVCKDRHLQKDFVTDELGNTIVDFIGKFENLYSDFKKVCNHLAIENISLPHKNKSSHINYRSYYTPYSKQLIMDAFKEDIEFFHYDDF